MGIFSIFKKRKIETADRKPAAIIRITQEYVPDFYKDNIHFKDSKEYLEEGEWGLALESLVDMADESGHYFSDTFWLDLAVCADKMNMAEQANYCRQQIVKNEEELGTKTINGWTTVKLDATHYQHHIAAIVKDEWATKRYQKDKLYQMIHQNGFHLKWHGRSGVIYYIENGKVLEIGFEMSGVPQYNMLLSFDTIETWAIPNHEPLDGGKKEQIKEELLQWLKAKKLATNLA